MKTPIYKTDLRYYSVCGSKQVEGRSHRINVNMRIVAPTFKAAIDHFSEAHAEVEITSMIYGGPVDVIINSHDEGER